MPTARNELELIKNALRLAPKGMSIIDLAETLQISRNSAAKYLEILSVAGEVDMRVFGRAKIYRLSGRVSLATALSLSSELIAFVDENLVVIDVNEPFLQYTGLKRHEIVGSSLEEVKVDILVHRGIILYVKDALNGREYIREIDVRRGGEDQYFKAKLIPVKAGDQRLVALVYENTTPTKKAELALKASEARYRAVVEDQTDVICRMLPDSTITFANDAMCELLKVSREAAVGQKLVDLIQPQYRAVFWQHFSGVRIDQPMHSVENPRPGPRGQTRWLHWTYRGIFKGERLAEVQFTGRDITDLKRAEAALRESNANLQILYDNAPIGICKVSADLRFLSVNPETCRITGYSERELLGMTVIDITHPDDRQRDKEMALAAIDGQEEYHCIEQRYVHKDGHEIWIRINGRLMRDETGRPIYFVSMFEDITDLKQAKQP